jgi:hypothetical protein
MDANDTIGRAAKIPEVIYTTHAEADNQILTVEVLQSADRQIPLRRSFVQIDKLASSSEQALKMLGEVLLIGTLLLVVVLSQSAEARTFQCRSGDVMCLIAAINQANVQPGSSHEIRLAAGTYTLTAVHNQTDGPNGLPSIITNLTITGVGAENTIIERNTSGPDFRLLHVSGGATLTLAGLTLRGGGWDEPNVSEAEGGGIYNRGTLILTRSILTDNQAFGGSFAGGGGIFNNGGTLTINQSFLIDNRAGTNGFGAGGGIFNDGGTVTIRQSTLSGNTAVGAIGNGSGGALFNDSGTVTITQSTLSDNVAGGGDSTGGGITNANAMVTIINSTLSGNVAGGGGGFLNARGTAKFVNSTLSGNSAGAGIRGGGGGLWNFDFSSLELQNSMVALNNSGGGPDCQGPVTSLGNNLIGDPANCGITLQNSDLTGLPGLGDFTDDGLPGHGHIPLLAGSQAINAGNKTSCPPRDQLNQQRVGICDIGAVEFQGPQQPLFVPVN